jgi:hypothetical protein
MGVDETRIPLQQHIRADPHFDGRINAHVRDENIGLVDQLKEDFHSLLGLQVYGNAALVAVMAFKIIVRTLEACGGADQTHKAARRIAFFGLNFNDVGPKISQSCPSFRPLLKHRDFYNPNTG